MELVWLLAAFLVPLVLNPWGSSAFDLPKAALVLMLALLAGPMALRRTSRPSTPIAPSSVPSPLIWPVLGFGATLVLATFFSINPTLSFWGGHARQQGLLIQLAVLGLFMAVAFGLHTHTQAERLLNVLAWGGAPVTLYGLWQAVGPDPLQWQSDAISSVLSTLGRPNFLASYLVIIIPVTLRCLLRTAWHWQYGLLLSGQLACLALTGVRSAWAGLVIAGLVFIVIRLISANRTSLALGIAATTVAATAVATGVVLARADEGSVSARWTIWRASLPLILRRPWLGYGPETTRAVFAPAYPPQLVYYQGRGVVVDRLHNMWLDTALTSGIAGVMALGGLWVTSGWLVWRNVRTGDQTVQLTWATLAAALSGHFVDMQAGVETVTSTTVAWLLLGLVAALGRGLLPAWGTYMQSCQDAPIPDAGETGHELTGRIKGWLPVVVPASVTVVLIGLLCARPLLADVAAWQALNGSLAANERPAAAERAVALWPVSGEYRRLLAGQLLALGDVAAAERQLATAAALEPTDAVVWALQGDLLAHHGYLAPAEAAYRRALELAPTIGLTHRALGIVLLRQGRLAEGIVALERAVDLDATDGVAFYHLARAYEAQGNEDGAAWAWRQALRWGY